MEKSNILTGFKKELFTFVNVELMSNLQIGINLLAVEIPPANPLFFVNAFLQRHSF